MALCRVFAELLSSLQSVSKHPYSLPRRLRFLSRHCLMSGNMKSITSSLLALAAPVLVTSAALFPRNSYPASPPCTVPFTDFVYSGCYHDGSEPRALLFDTGLDMQNMTVELCVQSCKANGYRYAGLEYYGQCFCGASVLGDPAEESMCSYPCTSNKNQVCGGNDYLSVYQDPTYPTEDKSVLNYKSAGCFSEGIGGRSLVYRQDQLSDQTMTTEKCLSACKQGGYPYAGTEFGGECYCGVVLTYGGTKAADELCGTPCTGNSSDTCGGAGALSLYVAEDEFSSQPCGYSSVPSSSTTATPTSSSTTTGATSASTTATAAATTTSAASTTSSGSIASSASGSSTTSSALISSTPGSTSSSASSTPTTTRTTSTSAGTTPTTSPTTTMKTSTTTSSTSTRTSTTTSAAPTQTPCGVGAACTTSCCSSCASANSFFCPKAANPFLLSCQNGKCVLPPPCAKRVCVTTRFNEKKVPAGSTIWLSAAFTPRFSIGKDPVGVAVVNSQVTIDSIASAAPDSYVELVPGAAAPGTVGFVNGAWQASLPTGGQSVFLSAVGVTVPPSARCSNAQVTWCGDITAPGQIDASVAAAVYSAPGCAHADARPQGSDAGKFKAGAPVGCANRLRPGGTGHGNGDCTGDRSPAYPVCRSGGCSKPSDNSGHHGYAGNGRS